MTTMISLLCLYTIPFKIIFSTAFPDNGGGKGKDNSPLRGSKGSYFNGGIQVPAFVASPLLSQSGTTHAGLVHVSDWLPTLINLAGGDVSDLELDGYDVWDSIRCNLHS